MVDVKAPPPREYINVMELLVAEEVEHQLRQLPSRILKYVKSIEVETYALNRLPSLYAVSEKGWQSQYHKAKYELRKDISNAVRQAIAAVQVDPLRASRPLVRRSYAATVDANAAALLDQFRAALGQPNLTWESLLRKCKRAGAARRGNPTEEPAPTEPYAAAVHSAATDEYATSGSYDSGYDKRHSHHSDHGTVWRPGTYGETSWHPKRNYDYQTPKPQSTTSNYDWNDSRYR